MGSGEPEGGMEPGARRLAGGGGRDGGLCGENPVAAVGWTAVGGGERRAASGERLTPANMVIVFPPNAFELCSAMKLGPRWGVVPPIVETGQGPGCVINPLSLCDTSFC